MTTDTPVRSRLSFLASAATVAGSPAVQKSECSVRRVGGSACRRSGDGYGPSPELRHLGQDPAPAQVWTWVCMQSLASLHLDLTQQCDLGKATLRDLRCSCQHAGVHGLQHMQAWLRMSARHFRCPNHTSIAKTQISAVPMTCHSTLAPTSGSTMRCGDCMQKDLRLCWNILGVITPVRVCERQGHDAAVCTGPEGACSPLDHSWSHGLAC